MLAKLDLATLNGKKNKADMTAYVQHVECPLITDNRQFQWTGNGNGHSQLPLAELGKPSPNIDLLRTTGSNGSA